MKTSILLIALLCAVALIRGREPPIEPELLVDGDSIIYRPVVRGSMVARADSITTWPRVDSVREGESIPVTVIVWFEGLPTACVPLEYGLRGWTLVELMEDGTTQTVRDSPRSVFDPSCSVEWPER